MTKHEAEIRAEIRASQIAKGLRLPDNAGRVTLPDAERGRSEYDLKRLDRINARLARGYKPHRGKSAEEQREEDLRRRDELEREISDRAEERSRLLAAAESDILAASRGETVEADKSGMRRVLERDPILNLARVKALTERQLDAAIAVRELYELRKSDAASAPFDGTPAGRHDHERFVATRFLRAKTCIPVGQLETALLNGHFRTRDGSLCVLKCWPRLREVGMEPNIALIALRWVCCEQNTLTSLGAGRAYDRNKRALCWALDVADEVLDWRVGIRS